MMKRLVCLMLSLMLAVGASFALAEETVTEAPAAETAPTEAPAAEAETAEATAAQDHVLLVTVNGKEIYSDDTYLQSILQYYLGQIDTSDPANVTMAQQYAMNYTIMIDHLARGKAAELGLDQFTDEEKAQYEADGIASWDSIIDSYIPQVNANITDSSTEEEKAAARADTEAYILATYNVAKEDYVRDYVNNQLENATLDRLVKQLNPAAVTDEDIEKYYEDLVAEDKEQVGDDAAMYEFYTRYYGMDSYYMPNGYRGITHILLKPDQALLDTLNDLNNRWEEQKSEEESEATEEVTEGEPETAEAAEATPEAEPTAEPTPTPEPVTEEMIEAAKKAVLADVQPKIDEIMAKLAAGTSFDDLIKEYGTDPGMEDEATRKEGYAVHENSIIWDPAFATAAMKLEKVGDVSDPVISSYGVHILHYLRDIPGGAAELTDDMKEEFRQSLQQEQDEEALATALDQWEEEANIVYTEAGEAWKLPEVETEEEDAEEAEAEEVTEEAAPEARPETAPEETPAP